MKPLAGWSHSCARAKERAMARGATAAQMDAVDAEVQIEIDAAMAFANASPLPDPAEAFTDIQTTGAGTWH